MSVGVADGVSPCAAVPGMAVLRENDAPPSLVERRVPSSRSRKPTVAEENEIDCTFEPQRSSLGVNGSRWKVTPPSSERRAEQPPPMITVLASTTSTFVRSEVIPVGMPLHVAPASSVRSSVPNSPAEYPRPPAKSSARIVFPCGRGLPQNQPEWPTDTGEAPAEPAVANVATARTATTAERVTLIVE